MYSSLLLVSLVCFAQETSLGNGYALVIIDMQPWFVEVNGYDKSPDNAKKVTEVLDNQVKLIELAKKKHIPIIFIEYVSAGDTNEKLKKVASNYKEVQYIKKNQDGMFYDEIAAAKIKEYLTAKKVSNLIIVGANGGACVRESIAGAVENGYQVIAYSKGIADFNYEEFIYPYDDIYQFNSSFKEVDDFVAMTRELSKLKISEANLQVNDSDRSLQRAEPRIKSEKSNEVRATPR